MPELPEVETVRRGLAAHLTGQVIGRVQCFRSTLRYPLPAALGELQDVAIESVERRAKYLLIHLQSGAVLVWHLGMTGQFHVLPSDAPRLTHEHIRMDLQNGQSLCFRDARRFGYVDLMEGDSWRQHRWFSVLGPEPFDAQFDVAYLYAACRQRKIAIKPLLMNASLVVGVGNIYASESLYRAGIRPQTRADAISRPRVKKLLDAVQEVLSEAIEAGGSSISDFVQVDGKPGYFAHNFRVYGREGLPCGQCGELIRKITQSGRSSFYCGRCQK